MPSPRTRSGRYVSTGASRSTLPELQDDHGGEGLAVASEAHQPIDGHLRLRLQVGDTGGVVMGIPVGVNDGGQDGGVLAVAHHAVHDLLHGVVRIGVGAVRGAVGALARRGVITAIAALAPVAAVAALTAAAALTAVAALAPVAALALVAALAAAAHAARRVGVRRGLVVVAAREQGRGAEQRREEGRREDIAQAPLSGAGDTGPRRGQTMVHGIHVQLLFGCGRPRLTAPLRACGSRRRASLRLMGERRSIS
ncbi:hypothetical protein BE20_08820 [Sorangium cellulosum]|nr:hypothetical protein BE20_08820 [Sorangium cellulosum]